MPGSVRNNQYSCPSQACQANQKAGGDKQSRAAVPRTKWSTSGGQRRGPGHRVQPKWTIVLYLQDHTAPDCGPSDTPQHPPTSHTYKSHIYLHQPSKPLIHSCSPSPGGSDLVVFFREEEKILCHKWMERLRYPHPPILQSAADCEADSACPAAKTLNVPQQSDWVPKAGLHFNIQCTNSLTFYSSLQ